MFFKVMCHPTNLTDLQEAADVLTRVWEGEELNAELQRKALRGKYALEGLRHTLDYWMKLSEPAKAEVR